jgi:hypothetical protein
MPHPAGGLVLCVGIGALAVAGYLWSRDAIGPAVPVAIVALLMLAPGWVLATPGAIPTPDDWSPLPHPAMTCRGEPVRVCLHRAYEAQLDDAVRFTEAYYAPLIGIAEIPEVVTQQPYWSDAQSAGTLPIDAVWTNTPVGTVLPRSLGHGLIGGDDAPLNASQNAILTWLAARAGGEWSVFPVAELDPVSTDTEAYARYEAEVDAAAERFAGLSPEAQRAWLSANWDALRAGTLSLDDLP